MSILQDKIFDYIDEHKEEVIRLLQKMIQFKSVMNNELDIQEYLRDFFISMGAEVDFWFPDLDEISKHPSYCVTRDNFDKSPILVSKIKGANQEKGKSLIINGHIDVVPEGIGWSVNPYEGVIKDGRIIGRGANDMKGGFAGAIMACKFLKDLGIKLNGDLIIESVIDEETGSAGSIAACMKGYKADAALIPEPTQYEVVIANQGSTFFRIKTKGKIAHGAYHYLGVNAIEQGHKVMDILNRLEKKRQVEFYNPLFERFQIQAPISVGKFNAGSWPSMTPDLAVMEGRYGITTRETVSEAKDYFIKFIMESVESDSWLNKNKPEIEWMEFWDSGETDRKAEIIKTVTNVYEELENNSAAIVGWAAPTDLSILTRFAHVPTVVYGPGNNSLHASDEYIEIDDLIKYVKHVSLILLNWCGVN